MTVRILEYDRALRGWSGGQLVVGSRGEACRVRAPRIFPGRSAAATCRACRSGSPEHGWRDAEALRAWMERSGVRLLYVAEDAPGRQRPRRSRSASTRKLPSVVASRARSSTRARRSAWSSGTASRTSSSTCPGLAERGHGPGPQAAPALGGREMSPRMQTLRRQRGDAHPPAGRVRIGGDLADPAQHPVLLDQLKSVKALSFHLLTCKRSTPPKGSGRAIPNLPMPSWVRTPPDWSPGRRVAEGRSVTRARREACAPRRERVG